MVLAEIQQRSDATFRLFDYGRQRELHEDNGVAVAHPWPLRTSCNPSRLTAERTVHFAGRHFVLERAELPEDSSWALLAEPETWISERIRGCGKIGRPRERCRSVCVSEAAITPLSHRQSLI
jgi:mannose-6-phosphate isomerase class I